jgi:predicted alpha/beta-hydrolase family hydrolase
MVTTIESKVEQATALLIFAHGAGADKSHAFMESFSEALNQEKFNVLRFNFPYMDVRLEDGKRRPPDRMPKLIDCFESVIAELSTDLPVFLIGKSMGGRVAATLASNESLIAKGIVCLGYPFHPQKKPEKLRLAPLIETTKPVLILQGTRDALGNKDEIEQYDFSTRCEVVFFEDGDHDLKPRVKSGFTHKQHLAVAVDEIKRFVNANI